MVKVYGFISINVLNPAGGGGGLTYDRAEDGGRKFWIRGNSLVLHCASLAYTHERVHVQNVRDFPQPKLDREIEKENLKF